MINLLKDQSDDSTSDEQSKQNESINKVWNQELNKLHKSKTV